MIEITADNRIFIDENPVGKVDPDPPYRITLYTQYGPCLGSMEFEDLQEVQNYLNDNLKALRTLL